MRTGRPRKLGSTTPVLVRIPDELLAELDAWVEQVRAAQVGTSSVTRSDLIRDVLSRAVRERGTSPPRRNRGPKGPFGGRKGKS